MHLRRWLTSTALRIACGKLCVHTTRNNMHLSFVRGLPMSVNFLMTTSCKRHTFGASTFLSHLRVRSFIAAGPAGVSRIIYVVTGHGGGGACCVFRNASGGVFSTAVTCRLAPLPAVEAQHAISSHNWLRRRSLAGMNGYCAPRPFHELLLYYDPVLVPNVWRAGLVEKAIRTCVELSALRYEPCRHFWLVQIGACRSVETSLLPDYSEN